MNDICKPKCQVISTCLSANMVYARYHVYLAYFCLGVHTICTRLCDNKTCNCLILFRC